MYKLKNGLGTPCQVNNSVLPDLIREDVCVNKPSMHEDRCYGFGRKSYTGGSFLTCGACGATLCHYLQHMQPWRRAAAAGRAPL